MKIKFIIGFLSLLLIYCCKNREKSDKPTCRFLKVLHSSEFPVLSYTININHLKNSNIHFIKEYNDSNEIVNIREYDKNSKEIFSYSKQYVHNNWPGKYVTAINAVFFNYKNEIIKSYYFHSNIGLFFNFFETDSIRNSLREYQIHIGNSPNSVNSNQFQNISKLHSISEILKNDTLKSFEKIKPKLSKEYFFDIKGNIIKKINYPDYINREKSIEINRYNSDNQLIYTNQNALDSLPDECYYLYSKKSNYDKKSKSNLLLFIRLDFDWQLHQKMPSNVALYEYNQQNLVISKIDFFGGKLNSKTTYSYDNQSRIKQENHYDYENDRTKIVQYTYNKYGHIEKWIETELRNQQIDTICIYNSRYEYIFYK